MGKGGFLGEFEQLVLLAVIRRRDDAYGIAIRQEIEDRTERGASVGAVYATLERLEAKGMISGTRQAPTPQPGGRSRRSFRVTPLGREALRQSREALECMWAGVSEATDGAPAAGAESASRRPPTPTLPPQAGGGRQEAASVLSERVWGDGE